MFNTFFSNQKKHEQSKRHVNCLFYLCLTKYVDDALFNQIWLLRNTEGYKVASKYCITAILPNTLYDFLLAVKENLGVDNTVFEEILGLKEVNIEVKTPGGYSKREDFILFIHALVVVMIVGLDERNKEFFSLISGLAEIDSSDKFDFIQNKLKFLLEKNQSFSQLIEMEEEIIRDFISNYNVDFE